MQLNPCMKVSRSRYIRERERERDELVRTSLAPPWPASSSSTMSCAHSSASSRDKVILFIDALDMMACNFDVKGMKFLQIEREQRRWLLKDLFNLFHGDLPAQVPPVPERFEMLYSTFCHQNLYRVSKKTYVSMANLI